MLRKFCRPFLICGFFATASSQATTLPNVLEIDSIDSTALGVTALVSTGFGGAPPSAIHLASYHCAGGTSAAGAPDGGEGLLIHPTGASGCNQVDYRCLGN